MLELLEKTRDFIRGKEEKKVATFAQLVDAVDAGGKKAPTPDKIDEALVASGKTLEELQDAVAYRQARRELVKQLATVPELEAEQQRVAANRDALVAEKTKAIAELDGKMNPLVSRFHQLNALIGQARACDPKLRDGYKGPLRDELAAIAEERRLLHQQIAPLQGARAHSDNWTRSAEEQGISARHHNPSAAEIEGHKKIVADCDRKLAELRGKFPALDAREVEIHQEMIQP